MSRNALVYDVLIASPTDVNDGRQVLSDVIRDWNSAHFQTRGIMLRELRWELDSSPGDGPAQANIMKQLVDGADILMGLFWSRLGSPTVNAKSGTAEEIAHFRGQGKPVLLYFSEARLPFSHDPEQLRRLIEYRESLSEGLYYWKFLEWEELRRNATRQLADKMNELSRITQEGLIALPNNGSVVKRIVKASGSISHLSPDEQPWILVEIENGRLYPQAPLSFNSPSTGHFDWAQEIIIGSRGSSSRGELFKIMLVAARRQSNYEFERYDRKDGDREAKFFSD